MRKEDYDRLAATYSGSDPDANEAEYLKALGSWSPSWRALFGAVFADLDPTRLGVGWWEHHLDTPRRILISDQLVVCLQSVAHNMNEARLHALELHAASDTATALASKRFRGGPRKPLPPATAPLEIAELEVGVHLGGFLRAVGSVLDCLAAVIIGVAAIPKPIFRADFKVLTEKYFSKVPTRLPSGTRTLHLELGSDLQARIAAVGPKNWLTWALEFRNMLVHRGRHITRKYVQANESPIVTSTGEATFTAKVIHLLPIDPGRAEVEVFRDAPHHALMLTEDAATTVEGISASTLALLEGTCRRLLEIWLARRSTPDLHPQPMQQWPDVNPSPMANFGGYAPESVPVKFQQIHTGGIVMRRLQSAAVLDAERHHWDSAAKEQ